jgi:hypothetical protein
MKKLLPANRKYVTIVAMAVIALTGIAGIITPNKSLRTAIRYLLILEVVILTLNAIDKVLKQLEEQ